MNTKYRSILLLILMGCNSTPDRLPLKEEPSVQIKDSVVRIDTFYMDPDEISSNDYREYYRCPFEEFVFDPTIPKFAICESNIFVNVNCAIGEVNPVVCSGC